MRLIRDYQDIPEKLRGASIAIGNFDGLHQGHQSVVDAVKQAAQTHQGISAIMTFEPHPKRFFGGHEGHLRIVPFAEKARLIRQQGIELVLAQRFNKAFSQLHADDFIEQVLVSALGVRHVITGENFIFGHKRSGDAQTLKDYADRTNAFSYEAMSIVGDVAAFSSTRIRECISMGEMEQAAILLGRPYAWSGRVIHGDQRGRTIGFPTANIRPRRQIIPRRGVYAVQVFLEDSNEPMEGVANVGLRPTVCGERELLEVHVFDREIDLYGKGMRVEFMAFIREEKKFEGIEALQTQITQDCQRAKDMLTA